MPNTVPRHLILASSSSYRKALLNRLDLTFTTDSPDIDEARLTDETPMQMASRLAKLKACALAAKYPDALIIGSDQTASCDDLLLGKPYTHARAVEQLSFCSAKTVTFNTGLCLFDTRSQQHQLDTITYSVKFLPLTAAQIEAYIKKEQPLDCAGSFKAEALGCALFESQTGDDPTALIGLPLIRLCAMLRQAGIEPLA